jgi:hypothetical protein
MHQTTNASKKMHDPSPDSSAEYKLEEHTISTVEFLHLVGIDIEFDLCTENTYRDEVCAEEKHREEGKHISHTRRLQSARHKPMALPHWDVCPVQ